MEHSVCRSLFCVVASEKSSKKQVCREELERRNGGVGSNEQVHVENLKEDKTSTRGAYIDGEAKQ